MKTWEMLKELTENPEERYEAYNKYNNRYEMLIDRMGYFELTIYDGKGRPFDEKVPAGTFSGNVNANDEWKKVDKVVSWQDALHGWAIGKAIKCRLEDWTYTYKRDVERLFEPMVDNDGDGLSAEEILEGKWYIL